MSLIPKRWLISGLVTSCSLYSHLVKAQVIPDETTNTNVTGDCVARCDITGGIQADSNLFHSFQEFNLGRGESLYFVDPGVADIFTRVTGNNSSKISGTLGVTGDANLWLLNPQGIIFGNGATLDVNGSFVATTADEIVFGDRGFFSANPDPNENLPLLTVNPSAFFYNQIEQNNPITLQGASLAVPATKNFVLLGSQNNESTPGILMEATTVNAPQGNIQIGAVQADGTVDINSDYQLQFPENIAKGNISLAQGSQVSTIGLGGGDLAIQAAALNLRDNSLVVSGTLGNIDGGEISIETEQLNLDPGLISSFSSSDGKAADINIDSPSINVTGESAASFQELLGKAFAGDISPDNVVSGITTFTNSFGASGNLIINSNDISITDGGVIAAITYNQGTGGSIDVTVQNNLQIDSSGLLTLSALKGGDAGDLNIKARNLTARQGTVISAATFAPGTGGDINIEVTEAIELSETPENSIIPTSIFTNSISSDAEDAGNITIYTNTLMVTSGAQISSASGLAGEEIIRFGGAGGNIEIQAKESVTVSGSVANNNLFVSSIISDTRSGNPAGNITINTSQFFLDGLAIVSASSFGTGNGGNLTINAIESINLSGIGLANIFGLFNQEISGEEIDFNNLITNLGTGLFSVTSQGDAGDINLNSPILSLNNGALVTTVTFGTGNGGNINITAPEIVDLNSSLIASSSLNRGNSGKIEVSTSDLIIRNESVLTTSTVDDGTSGDMIINATESVQLYNDENSELSFLRGIVTTNAGGGSGSAGNLSLKTKNLVIQDGFELNMTNEVLVQLEGNIPNTPSSTEPGNAEIEATESIIVSGSSINGNPSSINSSTATNVNANNIQITTPQLTVSEGADISVSSSGVGAAANLEIIVDRLNLETGGTLNANTVSGQGGNINLSIADTVELGDRASITTNALNQGDGGNITIDTGFLFAFTRSKITATAIAGEGGNIDITTQELFLASPDQISASSELGIDGEINISRFNNDFRNNLIELPEKPLETADQIVSHCGAGDESTQSSFVYLGKGALLPSPLDRNFDSDGFLLDWGTDATEFELHQIEKPTQSEIVEATALVISARGKVILTANQSAKTVLPHYYNTCPFNKN